jgi:hypothetical protein
MPLSTALPGLQAQILTALKNAQAATDPNIATANLARDLSQAIHAYALQTQVNPGQVVVTAGGPTTQTGATTSPGNVS